MRLTFGCKSVPASIMLAIGLLAFPAAARGATMASHSVAVAEAKAARIAPASPGSCTAKYYQKLPRSKQISNPALSKGGNFYYNGYGGDGHLCVGKVKEWVHYTKHATKTWRVHVGNSVVAHKTITRSAGYYYWTFTVDKKYFEPYTVCVGASDTPGYSCVYYSYL